MRPVTGVIGRTLEVRQAGNLGRVGRGETAQCGDDETRDDAVASIRFDGPGMRSLVEGGLGDARLELDVAAQVEAVGDMVGVAQDLGLGGVALGPFPFLLQLGGELVGVLHALDIAARAGVAIPVPGAAHTLAGLEDPDLETFQPQPVQHVHAAEAGADDHSIEIERHRSSRSNLVPSLAHMADTDYPASWYAATRDATPDRPSLNGRVAADVAIVGGGFAGLPTAPLLALCGLRVVLVERQRIGWGASGRNGGFVGPGFALRTGALIERLGEDHARQLYAQSQRGVEIVRASLKEMGRPDIMMGWGRLSVSRTDQGSDFAERSLALAQKLRATLEPWATDKVRALLVTERYFQGLHDATGFQIHPLNLALALAADTEKHGVLVHEDTEARALERRGAEWQLRPAMGEITARHVVLAGNADLGRVHRLSGAVLPVATYVAATSKLGPRLGEAIRWRGAIGDTRRAGDYYRIVDDDRLLWGGRITTDTREPAGLRATMRV